MDTKSGNNNSFYINLLRSRLFKDHTEMIWDYLNKENINYAYVKGEALSVIAYKKNGQRSYSDIDILISPQYVAKLSLYLTEQGFRQARNKPIDELDNKYDILCLQSSHQIIPFEKKVGKFFINIDINRSLFWGEYSGEFINIDDFLSDTFEQNIFDCQIRTLTPLKSLIQLVLHHYKDMNSIFLLATGKSIKYSMFQDIYYLLINNLKDIPINRLYDICSEYKIVSYCFYVLYYTNKIFNNDILLKYVEAFRTKEGEALIEYYGLTLKEKKKWNIDFKTRLEADSLYQFIKNDLTQADIEKININRRVFLRDYNSMVRERNNDENLK